MGRSAVATSFTVQTNAAPADTGLVQNAGGDGDHIVGVGVGSGQVGGRLDYGWGAHVLPHAGYAVPDVVVAGPRGAPNQAKVTGGEGCDTWVPVIAKVVGEPDVLGPVGPIVVAELVEDVGVANAGGIGILI